MNKFQAQNEVFERNENPQPFMAICPPHPSGMNQESLGELYPILNDYMGLELSTLAQNTNVAIPTQNVSAQVTNGVRKVRPMYILFTIKYL